LKPHRSIDVLKTVLQTLVLVTGALGSLAALVRNHTPLIIAIMAAAIVALIVIAEIRRPASPAPPEDAIRSVVPPAARRPILIPPAAPFAKDTGTAFRLEHGRLTIRASRMVT
jgi:hypothetical protein